MKTSTTHSYCDDDLPNENDILNIDANKNSYVIDGDNRQCRKRTPQVVDNDDYDSWSGYDESDSNAEYDLFLTSLDAKTVASAV
jgi:hypothetical protein